MALQMQSPTTTLHTTKCPPSLAPTANNAGLRKPFNPFALKSSFFTSSLNLLLHPNQYHLVTSGAPRISMRVASKQAYICRDCGYIYNERTPFEKLPDKYFCPGPLMGQVKWLMRHIGKQIDVGTKFRD